jgi:methionyl-tRNA synthetase
MNFATFLATHQWILVLAAVWTIPWKGVALWRAARNRSIAWFVVLLVINTLGILEIVYIFIISKKTETDIDAEEKSEALQANDLQETPKPEKMVLDIKKEEKTEEKLEMKEDEKKEEKQNLDEEVQKS